MTTRSRLNAELATRRYTRRHAREIVTAMLGNNAGTVVAATDTRWYWIRLHGDPNQVVRAWNTGFVPPIPDLPVDVEIVKANGITEYQIIGVSFNKGIAADVNAGAIGSHALQHQRRDFNAGGFDPLDIYVRALVQLRARAQATPDMTLYVEPGFYPLAGVETYWAGGNSPAFTAPGGGFRCDLLYFDSAGALQITTGTIVLLGTPPRPATPANSLPLAYIYMAGVTTSITEYDIEDARMSFGANLPSTMPPSAHNILSASHGDTLADSVVRGDIIYGNATPKWARLAHPGAANRFLTTTATDVLWSTWKLIGTSMAQFEVGDDSDAYMYLTATGVGGIDTASIYFNYGTNYYFNTIGGGRFDFRADPGGFIYFAIANTKQLKLIATDNRDVTFPITGTVAMGAGTLTVSTASDVTVANHLHPITSSSNPGAAAAILASTAAGGLTLQTLTIPATTATVGIIYQGASTLIHTWKHATADGYNTFVGVGAGNLTMSPGGGASSLASSNTGVGYGALASLTTGNLNTALGDGALTNATIAASCTAVGHSALSSNTTGSNNTAVGGGALQANTIGTKNIALGIDTLVSNVDGGYNIAIGSSALRLNVSASQNVAIGDTSIYSNTTGTQNAAVGNATMYSNTEGSQNIAVGYYALNANTQGSYNCALGATALQSNTTGSGNMAMGYNSLNGCVGGGNNVAIGVYALATIANVSNCVGIGYGAGVHETAGSKLFIDGLIRASEAAGRTESLIYGVFNAAVNSQYLTVNGHLQVTATAGTSYILDNFAVGKATTAGSSVVDIQAVGGAIPLRFDDLRLSGAGYATVYMDSWITNDTTSTETAQIGAFGSVNLGGTPTITYLYLSAMASPAYNNANLYLFNATGNVGICTTTDGMTSGGSLAIAKDLAHRGTKVGFYNATPITQPSGDIIAALGNLGAVATPVLPYGAMYANDVSVTVTIAAPDTYVEVGSGLSAGLVNGFTFQSSKQLRCDVAGDYEVRYSMTVEPASGANVHIEGGVMVNSTGDVKTANTTHCVNSTDEQSVSGGTIITLAVNDVVKLCVKEETGAIDVVVTHANLWLSKVKN